jgi:hypothetical protein
VLALGRDLVNLSVISGRDVEVTGFVQCEIPDVLRARGEIFGGTPRGIKKGLGRFAGRFFGGGLALTFGGIAFFPGLVLDFVTLPSGAVAA